MATNKSDAPKVDADRQARWDAFLVKAEKDNATFDLQKANGEFETIPDSFV